MTDRLRAAGCRPEVVTSSGASIALVSNSASNVFWQNDEFCLAVEGYPRWQETPVRQGGGEVFAQRFVAGYRQHGPGVLADVQGQFSLVLTRKDGQWALLATDRIGSQPLKYAILDDILLFGSYADAIAAVTPQRRDLDPQALFNYVYFEMIPGPGTAFLGIHRLLPGEFLQFRCGTVKREAYSVANYLQSDRRAPNQLETELMRLLEDSVRSSISQGKTGAFLSGGIDSSTVTGMLGRVAEAPAHSYSIGFDAPGYDEMEFARIAARHFGSDHHEYYVTPRDVAQAAPQVAAAYDGPFGNASAIPALYCARLAESDGVDHLLGGDGGDELFGGNSRYAKQWIFSLYDNIPYLIRRGLIEPAITSSLGRKLLPRKLTSYINQAATSMPERAESYNLLSRLGPQRIFTDDFISSVNPLQPLEMIAEAYHGARADNMLERMLAVDMRFALADNDLPKVRGMCSLAGVSVSFPFLDDRLVSFAQQLPAQLKVRRTHLRYFFKQAISGLLPPEIITKKKHGFGLPFGVWLKNDADLQGLARDALAALKQRNIIRPEFVDDLLSNRLEEHAAYYGTMAWQLMMLELWLQSRSG